MKNIRALEIPLDCHAIMGLDQPELFLTQELVEFGQRPGKEFSLFVPTIGIRSRVKPHRPVRSSHGRDIPGLPGRYGQNLPVR